MRRDRWFAMVTAAAVALALGSGDPVVNGAVVIGLGVVAPLSFGEPAPWALAALVASVGLRLDPGTATGLAAVPALAAAVKVGVPRARVVLHERNRDLEITRVADMVAAGWAGVAACALGASLANARVFGIGEPIIRLTAVHFLYAGVGALTLASRLAGSRSRNDRGAWTACLATMAAPPVVAVGFTLSSSVGQIGGAVLMTVGVWTTAALMLIRARSAERGFVRGGLTVAGLSPWVPMMLAVSWAAAQHIADVPALTIPEMARTHGIANGLGFVLVGLAVTRVPSLAPRTAHREMGS